MRCCVRVWWCVRNFGAGMCIIIVYIMLLACVCVCVYLPQHVAPLNVEFSSIESQTHQSAERGAREDVGRHEMWKLWARVLEHFT